MTLVKIPDEDLHTIRELLHASAGVMLDLYVENRIDSVKPVVDLLGRVEKRIRAVETRKIRNENESGNE